MSYKSFSYWASLSRNGPVNPSTPTFNPDRNNGKFNFCLEIQPEMAARISIFTLYPLKLPANQIHI